MTKAIITRRVYNLGLLDGLWTKQPRRQGKIHGLSSLQKKNLLTHVSLPPFFLSLPETKNLTMLYIWLSDPFASTPLQEFIPFPFLNTRHFSFSHNKTHKTSFLFFKSEKKMRFQLSSFFFLLLPSPKNQPFFSSKTSTFITKLQVSLSLPSMGNKRGWEGVLSWGYSR